MRLYLLDDKALKHELAVGALQQAALHTVSSGQPEHQHWLGLPDAVSPVHGLQQQQRWMGSCCTGLPGSKRLGVNDAPEMT